MEARGELEHRTKVKPRKAGRFLGQRASQRDARSDRDRQVVGTMRQEEVHTLPLMDSEVRASGRTQEGNEESPTPKEFGIISQ